MIFGKHINKYYRQNWYLFLVGIIALIFVDIYQLEIPRQIGFLIDGLSEATNPSIICSVDKGFDTST